MNHSSRLLIAFEPTFDNIDMIRAAVQGVCSNFFRLDGNATSIMDFCLTITELLNNAVEHASTQEIKVEILLSGQEAIFRLISEGIGFDPTPPAMMPDVEENDLPEGGYGLALIQTLSDSMEYECRENKNTVTLHKIFPTEIEEKKSDGLKA